MSIDPQTTGTPMGRDIIEKKLQEYLTSRIKAEVTPGQDIFAQGLVNSMFAMELVVYLEREFGIEIIGSDLQLRNFRSVDAMVEIVTRLQANNES